MFRKVRKIISIFTAFFPVHVYDVHLIYGGVNLMISLVILVISTSQRYAVASQVTVCIYVLFRFKVVVPIIGHIYIIRVN